MYFFLIKILLRVSGGQLTTNNNLLAAGAASLRTEDALETEFSTILNAIWEANNNGWSNIMVMLDSMLAINGVKNRVLDRYGKGM